MNRPAVTIIVVSLMLTCTFSAAEAQTSQSFSTPWMHTNEGDWATKWGVIDPEILFLPSSWGKLTGATGDWHGIRSDLTDAGVSVFGAYESESAGNPIGGEDHKFRYAHNLELGVAMDRQLPSWDFPARRWTEKS